MDLTWDYLINYIHGPRVIETKKHIFPLFYCFTRNDYKNYWHKQPLLYHHLRICTSNEQLWYWLGRCSRPGTTQTAPRAGSRHWLLAGSSGGPPAGTPAWHLAEWLEHLTAWGLGCGPKSKYPRRGPGKRPLLTETRPGSPQYGLGHILLVEHHWDPGVEKMSSAVEESTVIFGHHSRGRMRKGQHIKAALVRLLLVGNEANQMGQWVKQSSSQVFQTLHANSETENLIFSQLSSRAWCSATGWIHTISLWSICNDLSEEYSWSDTHQPAPEHLPTCSNQYKLKKKKKVAWERIRLSVYKKSYWHVFMIPLQYCFAYMWTSWGVGI